MAALDAQPPPHALRAWLATTVRNLSHHVRRAESRRTARERKVARQERTESGLDVVARTELHREPLRHVLELPEPHRTTLLLRYVDELQPRAMAARCSITPAAARARLARAHGQLRRRLQADPEHHWRANLLAVAGLSIPPAGAAAGAFMAMKQSTAIGGALAVLLLALGAFFWLRDDDASDRAQRRDAAKTSAKRSSGATAADSDATETKSDDTETTSKSSSENESENEIAPADSAFRVTGRVIWEGQAPRTIAVRVIASRVGDHVLGTVRSDAAGRFTTPLPNAGRFAVEATHDGTIVRRRFELSAATPTKELDITFAAGAVLSGQVHNTFGALDDDVHGSFRPAGQEELEVHVIDGKETGKPLPFSRVDARGSYRIAGLPAGTYFLLVPSKFHIEKLTIEPGAALTKNIRLATGRIDGTVRDAQTKSVVGPWVQVVIGLRASEDNREQLFKAAGRHRVNARCAPDDKGRYSFSNLPAGEYSMFANGGAYGLHRASATLRAPDHAATVDFAMEKGSVLDTTITNAAGEKLDPMLIWTQRISWGFQGPASGLKPGTFDVSVWGREHAVATKPGVVFKPGETTKLTFKLTAAAPTRLQFRDERDQPIVGVRVAVWSAGQDVQQLLGRAFPTEPLTVSDKKGEVFVGAVAAGACRLVAKRSGFALFDKEIRLVAGKTTLVVPLEASDTKFLWRLRITRIADGSAAQRAGLAIGDLIVSYDGAEIESLQDLRQALAKTKQSGATHAGVIYERAGQQHEIRVATGTLGLGLEEFEVKRPR